ncbi:MADS-box transcription factor PHERES 2, partial [Mucuna pruriens]
MARKKVKLAFISDEKVRKSTYKNRKKGIIKKVELWPNQEAAKQVIERYMNTSMLDRSKNVNQESFIMQRIVTVQDQLKKQHQENFEKEVTFSMFQCMQGENLPNTGKELTELDKLIEQNMKKIEQKLVALNCEFI